MNTKIKILIFSIIITIAHIIYTVLLPQCYGSGLACADLAIGTIRLDVRPIFVGVIFVPLIFWILRYLLTPPNTSWGKRLTYAFILFGISYLAVLLVGTTISPH